MPEALLPILRSALQWLGIQGILGNVGAVADALQQLGSVVEWLTEVVQDVFGAAKGGEDYSEEWARRAGEQIDQMGSDIEDITVHTYLVLVPHSLAYLLGYIVSHYIEPIQRAIDNLQTRVGILEGFRRSTDEWRYKYVDPAIQGWKAFQEWFDSWPRGILFRWKDYFENPSHFADWATPPIVGPFIAYLANKDHSESRDNLTSIIIDDTPNRWRHVERAALAILEQDYP